MTEPNEPEYLDIYNEQQRGAFGSFGHLLLYGAGPIAAGMHIEFRHSVVQLLGLGS